MPERMWILHATPNGYPVFRCLDCSIRSCCWDGSRCSTLQTGPYPHRWQKIGTGKTIFKHITPFEESNA